MKMKTGMKRSVCRIISFMMVFTLLSAYGCNKGKTIDPDFYPTQNVSEEVYANLTSENIAEIKAYIESPMTATIINDSNICSGSREQPTAELIYYWMIALNIPFECQKWHLNRLLTLIRVCSIKNQTPKKRSQREIMSRNAALNAARRKKYNTRG